MIKKELAQNYPEHSKVQMGFFKTSVLALLTKIYLNFIPF